MFQSRSLCKVPCVWQLKKWSDMFYIPQEQAQRAIQTMIQIVTYSRTAVTTILVCKYVLSIFDPQMELLLQ